jgi:nitrite reductase/ring-hydroxylating ferredoxin subunit
MIKEGFTKLCRLDELNEGAGKRFIVDETEVAVFKINNEIFALSNICPHQHTALIYDGFIENDFVVCPAHGWMFNLRTGKQPKGQRGLDSFPVTIFEDEIYVKVFKKEFKW